MDVTVFIGPSGSGKSHRSIFVAKERGIEAIIDDGLLISKNSILAGVSAKKEATKIASVKRALFKDDDHLNSVREAIKKNNIKSIMILGTSENMVKHIANRIELGEINHTIYITDVATPKEIEKAQQTRLSQGKHVIPVPTFEIKKEFSGYFIAPIKFFMHYGKKEFSERSVVRPTFSYLGDYKISNNVMIEIVKYNANKFAGFLPVGVSIKDGLNGLIVNISLAVKFGAEIPKNSRLLQDMIKNDIERHTALNIKTVNIIVTRLYR